MVMPSGNIVIPDKMHFPAGGGGGSGCEIQPPPHRQWLPDERDGFIYWLRSEFAAANAIIDALCHHLRVVGEPGEYDAVIGSVQQRRCNWIPVLHMQQYFSVAEVLYSLQQVGWWRQQRYHDHFKGPGKDFKRFQSLGARQGHRVESVKDVHCSTSEFYNTDRSYSSARNSEKVGRVNDKSDGSKPGDEITGSDNKDLLLANEKQADNVSEPHLDSCLNNFENTKGTVSGVSDPDLKGDDGRYPNSQGSRNALAKNDSQLIPSQNSRQNLSSIPKTFFGTDIIDGKPVNVVDGLKLYEGLYGVNVTKLVSLVNDLRDAGRRGHFQGQTFVMFKRPMRGHGREMIQLGLPIADSPLEDEIVAGNSKDRKIEPIPPLLEDVIEHMCDMQAVTSKPDSCIIDFYNEGDHSQPHGWPSWFGRPICLLSLSECDLTFGRAILADHPGDYKGSLNLSLSPGSLLVMEGKSADIARHAIPSLCKQRCLVTMTKYQQKRFSSRDGQRSAPSPVPPPHHWRLPSPTHHPLGPKHYTATVSTSGTVPPPNSIQPLFMPAPATPAIPFPAPVALPPHGHPVPRVPPPGTGVFFPPPGSGNSSPPHQVAADTVSWIEKDNGGGEVQRQQCNGSINGNGDVEGEGDIESTVKEEAE